MSIAVAEKSPARGAPRRRAPAARKRALEQEARVDSFADLVDSPLIAMAHGVQRGLSPRLLDDAADYLQVPKAEIMAITEVKAASLSRWMRDGQALPLGESDRLARVARVAKVARQVLGGDAEAVQWLNTPVPALGNVKPLSLLTSDASSRIVEDTLTRAAAGVYA